MLQTLLPQEKWILLGIPVLFLIGSLLHYLYQLTEKNPLIGLIAPINESVWEHTKMVVLPLIMWWSIFYLTQGQHLDINIDSWFTGLIVSLLAAIFTIPFLYYFYTEAFGVSLLWVDILILLLALAFGQILGLHVLRHNIGISYKQSISIIFFILILYGLFTIHPPKLPLFRSN